MGAQASPTSRPRSGLEHHALPGVLLIAGFGDNASMFDGVLNTHLADRFRLLPVNLPGFGAPALASRTTLRALASVVKDIAEETGAEIIIAHSVASVIASLAAEQPDCPITTVLSLEGNITADDAYFSGTAADYTDPHTFRKAFLARLDAMAVEAPIIGRYRQAVSEADPQALWHLGTDARRFSADHVPGEVLKNSAKAVYFYNPENCPDSTLQWLEENPMDRVVMDKTSHWASVDQPELLADRVAEALRRDI